MAQQGKTQANLTLTHIGIVYLYLVTFCFCVRGCSFFMKVILEKRYAMAYRAVYAVTAHFLRIHKETKVMPVIWHQTLLAFVQW